MPTVKKTETLNYAVNYYATHRTTVNSKGQIHSIGDSPAEVHSNGKQVWYKNGLIHRDDGKPAVEYADGSVEFWINGSKIDKKVQYSKLNELIALRDQMNVKIKEYADQHGLAYSFDAQPVALRAEDYQSSVWESSGC